MWPDDVYVNLHGDGILKQLLDVYEAEGGMVENIMEFPREQMVRYGALVGAVREAGLSGPKVWLKNRRSKMCRLIMPAWGRIFCRMRLCKYCRKFVEALMGNQSDRRYGTGCAKRDEADGRVVRCVAF